MPSERSKTDATASAAMKSPTMGYSAMSSVESAVSSPVSAAMSPTAVSPSCMHSCRAGEADHE